MIPDVAATWTKRKKETEKVFEKFQYYRDLPPGERTFKKVEDHFGISSAYVYRLAKNWDWQSRAHAYDVHRDEVRLNSLDKNTEKDVDVWAERQRNLKEEMYITAMLAMQVVKEKLVEGQTTDVSAIFKAATSVAIQATGLDTGTNYPNNEEDSGLTIVTTGKGGKVA